MQIDSSSPLLLLVLLLLLYLTYHYNYQTRAVVPGGGKAIALPYSMGLCLPGDTTCSEWSWCRMDGGEEIIIVTTVLATVIVETDIPIPVSLIATSYAGCKSRSRGELGGKTGGRLELGSKRRRQPSDMAKVPHKHKKKHSKSLIVWHFCHVTFQAYCLKWCLPIV